MSHSLQPAGMVARAYESCKTFERRVFSLKYKRWSDDSAQATGMVARACEVRQRLAEDKQILWDALYSDVGRERKVMAIKTHDLFRISPNDEAALATEVKVAEAAAAKATATVLRASATAGALSAGGTVAGIYLGSADPERIGRLAAATAERAGEQRRAATSAAECAVHVAEQALLEMHFTYKGSVLQDVVRNGDYPQLRTLCVCGLKLTRYTAWRVIKDILTNNKLGMEQSLKLLRCILDSDRALDVCYVCPNDDVTVLGLAVQLQRVDMAEALLDHTPRAVHVAGASCNLPPALCVHRWRCTLGAAAHVKQHPCARGADCEQRNCNNDMNRLLYERGANPCFVSYGGQTNRGKTARLCCSGMKEVADAMDRRMRKFLLQLQIVFLRRVCVHKCPLKLLDGDLFRDHIVPHLGWAPEVSPCTEVSLVMYPWFPRRPPASWKLGTTATAVPSSANMSDSE
jgi:hypothetical protein